MQFIRYQELFQNKKREKKVDEKGDTILQSGRSELLLLLRYLREGYRSFCERKREKKMEVKGEKQEDDDGNRIGRR